MEQVRKFLVGSRNPLKRVKTRKKGNLDFVAFGFDFVATGFGNVSAGFGKIAPAFGNISPGGIWLKSP
jgi:hypothetical protein